MVDELKEEGDFSNPFIILFAFSILIFFSMEDRLFENLIAFLQYMLIGIGMGIAAGIIVFKSMKYRNIEWFHEIGLIAVAIILYVIAERIGGSGLFAIMVLGVFFGNSFVKKKAQIKSFSPFILKSLEILIYLMIGFVAILTLNIDILVKSLLILVIYLIIRFITISIAYKHYSIQNKLLLTFAPKGMVFGSTILVLGSYGTVPDVLISVMLLILVFSLIISTFYEYYENKKINRLERLYLLIKNLRFGRKRDLVRKRISLFNIFKTKHR
jgi:cell volume regulation protein A